MYQLLIFIFGLGYCTGQLPSSAYLPSSAGRSPSFNQYGSPRGNSVGGQYSAASGPLAGRAAYTPANSRLANSAYYRGQTIIAPGSYSGVANAGYQLANQIGRHTGNDLDNSNSEPARYEFKYDVSAPEYAVEFGHEEQRDGDNTSGSYYVLLPDGRRQLVEYTADVNGYHPRISYSGNQDTTRGGGSTQGRPGGGYQQGGNYQSGAGYQSRPSGSVDYQGNTGY